MIAYSRHQISQSDIDAVVEVLRSDWLTQGCTIDIFEDAVASYCSPNGLGVAFNSATSALHAACNALGVGKGDRVWTVPNTFVASANCAIYCGASIDFVDIDCRSWVMCPNSLLEKLESAEKMGCLPKVIIPVHFAGVSADMKSIKDVASRFGVKIIEDASHALGAKHNNSFVGCCEFSDITVFSFHPVKMITTGEGGMAVTNDPRLKRSMQLFRSHGVSRKREEFEFTDNGPWSYQQIDLGFNYRMTDIAAALGCSQLKKLDDFVLRRTEIVSNYVKGLDQTAFQLQHVTKNNEPSWHLMVVCLQSEIEQGNLRGNLFDFLISHGIGVNVHYEPVHLQPYFRKMGFSGGDYPKSESYAKRCLSVPIHPGLAPADIDFVIEKMNAFVRTRV